MLTIKQIRDDKEAAARKLAKKGVDAAPVIEKIISFDDRRKALQLELDNTLAAQNKAAKEIGALMGRAAARRPRSANASWRTSRRSPRASKPS